MTAVERVSLIDTSVRDPGELYKVVGPMLRRFEQQMVYTPTKPSNTDEPPPKSLFASLADSMEQISKRHDLYTRNVQPCLLFWWMCDVHAGTSELILSCEPPDSRWRNPAEFARLKKFARMHILAIKNTTIIPETVETLAATFHLSMFEVIAGDRTVAEWLFDSDTRDKDEKIGKESKNTNSERPPAPANSTSCLAVPYLPGVCRGRSKKAAKSAGSRPATNSRKGALAPPTPIKPPTPLPTANAMFVGEEDMYNVFIIDGGRYVIE